MDVNLTLETLMILATVASIAGFIDALAGGGGLLTIPAMLLANIPPIMTLGTNKLQASAGSLTASYTMIKKQIVKPKQIKIAIVTAFLGSALGTILVQSSPPQLLEKLIPFLIAGIGIYTLFSPSLSEKKSETAIQKPKISEKSWQKFVVPLIGFYDGYLGPGTGTFMALSNVALRCKDIVTATGIAKVLNFSTNIASLIFFIAGGNILWKVGLIMMAGQTLGAFIGSHMAIKKGVKLIRPMIVIMCLAMLAKYLLR